MLVAEQSNQIVPAHGLCEVVALDVVAVIPLQQIVQLLLSFHALHQNLFIQPFHHFQGVVQNDPGGGGAGNVFDQGFVDLYNVQGEAGQTAELGET